MKKISIVFILMVLSTAVFAQEARNIFFDTPKKEKEKYVFTTSWRIAASYVQDWQKSNSTYPDTYLHGGKIGALVDFSLPYHMSLQTGVNYALTGNYNNQHWRSISAETTQEEYIHHLLLKHTLEIPVHLYYNQQLWKQLRLFFLTGPNFQIGLAYSDNITTNLSDGAKNWLEKNGLFTEKYDKYKEKELYRFNFQWTVGGGLEWDKYRIFGTYNFGLNNLVNNYPHNSTSFSAQMREWSWSAGFAICL